MGDTRLSKEEIKRIKQLNRSLVALPKSTQQSLGVLAVQREDGVFFLGNNLYIKIYLIKPPILEERKHHFLSGLIEVTGNRVRITSVCKSNGRRLAAYSFMTVYYNAFSYADAYDQILEFEKVLHDRICQELSLTISKCSLDEALSFMQMNCTGALNVIEHAGLIVSKNSDWKKKLFEDLTDAKTGSFRCREKYGSCFSGSFYMNSEFDNYEVLLRVPGTVLFSVDIQRVGEEDKKLLSHELTKKYNDDSYEDNNVVNMKYLMAVMFATEKERNEARRTIIELYDKNSIMLTPCSGREKEAFYSLCSMGVIDFHSMRNADMQLAGSLLI